MTLATLAGVPVARARVAVPSWGVWWADVDLTEDAELSGRVSLVLADITLSGTIISGGVHSGRAAYRVAAGAGGWGVVLPAKAYHNDLGIKVSTLFADAAAGAGEALVGAPATRLGAHYARASGPASTVLNALAPRGWYVDFAGTTQIGARESSVYSGSEPRTRVDPGVGVIEIATEELAALVPGVTIDGSLPATDVEYTLDATRLTARVLAGRATSRRAAALAKLLASLDPGARYRGVYEYRVVTQAGDRLNLQIARVASGMPDLANVPVRPGMAGLKANVALGELVLVAFADSDPSRPCVIAHEAVGAPGWMPLTLQLGETPALGAARMTDAVVAGPFAGTIVGGSARVSICL